MIKAVLWDIDNTLLDFNKAESYAIRKCFDIFGLGECTDEMIAQYSKINRGYWERLERGEIEKKRVLEGRFEDFFALMGLPVEKAAAFNAEYQMRLGDKAFFCVGGEEAVKRLKGKVLQYAVTNGTFAAQSRKLANSGLDKLLDGVFISDVIGVEKPNAGFFEYVFGNIDKGIKKDEIMIVGDSLTSDMLGGNNAGILCCWYNPDGKTRTLPDEMSGEVRIDFEIRDLREVVCLVFDNKLDVQSLNIL